MKVEVDIDGSTGGPRWVASAVVKDGCFQGTTFSAAGDDLESLFMDMAEGLVDSVISAAAFVAEDAE